MALKKICRCGKIIDNGTIRCDNCQQKHDESNKDRKRYYNKFIRDKDIQRVYTNKRWVIISSIARDRDNGLCMMCLGGNKIVSYQAVHHIITIKDDKLKAYDVNNLICLCESCHRTVHNKYDSSQREKIEMQNYLLNLLNNKQK